ncbi:unnamed protein product [Rotaria magnacalcarata]|nr:unnamed protein product [Rotaria magnacalcarata]
MDSPIRPSSRILRSSSISSESNSIISRDVYRKPRVTADIVKEIVSGSSKSSRSVQKIKLSVESASNYETNNRSSQIFDMSHLKECIESAHVCQGGRLELIIDTKMNFGLFHKNALKCSICDHTTNLTNFPTRSNEIQEPNHCLYSAGAISGIGYDATHFLLSLLGLSMPHRDNFYKQVHNLYDQLFYFAHQDFLCLIDDVRRANQCELNVVMDLTVSLDGTWKKRGHQSLYGIVFLIEAESGYCLDFETVSKRCELCEGKKRTLTTIQFERWYTTHQSTCSKTWDGTSGGMEKEGARKIFERSLEKGLRYKHMISDGDSSAYESVKLTYIKKLLKGFTLSNTLNNDLYSDFIDENANESNLSQLSPEQYEANVVIKEDCINHVKKRVSTHLKTLKNRHSGFEKPIEENLASVIGTAKDSEVTNDESSDSNQQSPSEDDTNISLLAASTRRVVTRRRRLADGKMYGGGVGRMTKLMEHKLADSYGIAIRQSSAIVKSTAVVLLDLITKSHFFVDLDQDQAVLTMQRYCRAAFLHNIKQSDRELQHACCPTGFDSWCSYQRDKHVSPSQRTDHVKNTKRLDAVFLDILTPMIESLTDPSLLRRCLRGMTQNANESINSVVWSILSKAKYHGYQSVRGAAAISSIFFNRGRSGLVKFFHQAGIPITENLLDALLEKDWKRIEKAENHVQRSEAIRQRKDQQRIQAQIEADEEMDYGSGLF